MALTLVTGGTGHLGQDIVDRLVRDGHRVRVLARSPAVRSDGSPGRIGCSATIPAREARPSGNGQRQRPIQARET